MMKQISETAVVVLAAGKGTRMQSSLPKVLHKANGKTLLHYVIDNAKGVFSEPPYVVVGYMADEVKRVFKDHSVRFVLQKAQLGTGHAVMQTREYIADTAKNVVVLNGDMPLIDSDTIKKLFTSHRNNKVSATVLSAKVSDAEGYGRIVKNPQGELEKIVEQKDATAAQLQIDEINTGTYCFDTKDLFWALDMVKPDNAQGEYYLTDVISILKNNGKKVSAFVAQNDSAALGINTKEQLAQAEKLLLARDRML